MLENYQKYLILNRITMPCCKLRLFAVIFNHCDRVSSSSMCVFLSKPTYEINVPSGCS